MRFADRLRAACTFTEAKPAKRPAGTEPARDVLRDVREFFGVSPHRELAAYLDEPSPAWRSFYGCWAPATPRVPSPDSSLVELVEAARRSNSGLIRKA